MKRTTIFTAALLGFLSVGIIAQAQIPAPPPAPEVQPRSSADLDQMLGPIALYPDPLIAQILPAATLPSEIVLADRYVSGGGDPNLIDQQPWDPSVKALARYPTVLKWMDVNLAWTTDLGQMFLYQPQDVMDSIQRLRAQAQALGNLQTTPQENVFTDDGAIEILPADPQVIYVPVYQPGVVYFQRPYGSPFVSFGVGLALGVWLNHDFDWRNHHLIVWRHDQPRPPDWWFHRPSERPPAEVSHAAVWQPRNRPGLAAPGLDRGWNSRQASNPVNVTVIRDQPRPQRSGTPAPPARQPQPVVVQHPAQAPRSRPANGALIGIQSSQQTRQFSSRGQQSRQVAAPRPAAPPSRPAAPARPAAPSRPPNAGKH